MSIVITYSTFVVFDQSPCIKASPALRAPQPASHLASSRNEAGIHNRCRRHSLGTSLEVDSAVDGVDDSDPYGFNYLHGICLLF